MLTTTPNSRRHLSFRELRPWRRACVKRVAILIFAQPDAETILRVFCRVSHELRYLPGISVVRLAEMVGTRILNTVSGTARKQQPKSFTRSLRHLQFPVSPVIVSLDTMCHIQSVISSRHISFTLFITVYLLKFWQSYKMEIICQKVVLQANETIN